jgi:hypothetical protein
VVNPWGSVPAGAVGLGLATAVLVVVAAGATKVEAQLARRGNEFRVNSVAGGDQTDPQIAALPDGGFFVVWRSNGDLLSRRFSSTSQPLGPELKVNETIPDTHPGQRLAVAGDGSVLVTWCAFMPPASSGIVGRRYDATGIPDGPPFTILERGSYWGVAVGATGASEFVVALARTVGPTGVGPIFLVADDGNQYNLAIGSAATDRYQIVWYDESLATMQGRSFAGERPSADTFPISMVNSSGHQGPAICSRPDGDFVVTWVTLERDEHSSGTLPVRYRAYDAQSAPLSSALAITPEEIGQKLGVPHQLIPAITCGMGTEFTVVWLESENPAFSVRGRRFVGDTSTPTFRIGLEGEPAGLSVARLTDGDDVATWSEWSAPTGCDVFAQRFTSRRGLNAPGDCNGDGEVTIDELVAIVQIILSGEDPVFTRKCLMADVDLNYVIGVNELVMAVNQSLRMVRGTAPAASVGANGSRPGALRSDGAGRLERSVHSRGLVRRRVIAKSLGHAHS